jgi:hypothetical protein
VLSFAHHPADGSIALLQADPCIEIEDRLLDVLDPAIATVGDGIVTFHASNGTVSYGLRDYDDIREIWIGVRSDIADEDLPRTHEGSC